MGGVGSLLKIPGGGFSPGEGRRGGRGAGRVPAGNLGGGGVMFFFGAEMPTKQRKMNSASKKTCIDIVANGTSVLFFF